MCEKPLFIGKFSNVASVFSVQACCYSIPPCLPFIFSKVLFGMGTGWGSGESAVNGYNEKEKGVGERERERWKKIFFFLLFYFSFLVPDFVFLFVRMVPLPFYLSNWSLVVFLGLAHSGYFLSFSGLCFFCWAEALFCNNNNNNNDNGKRKKGWTKMGVHIPHTT